MKANKMYRIVCAEGSQALGPGRISSNPEPAEQGRQRDIIVIQKPAPMVSNSTKNIRTGIQ